MSGVFATDAPASGPAPRPIQRPSSWAEQAGAAWRLALDDDEAANYNNQVQAYNAIEDSLVALGRPRSRYNNPEWRSFTTTVETAPQRFAALWADVEAERARDPSRFKDIPKTRAEFDTWAYARQGRRAADIQILENGSSLTARLLPGLGFGISQLAQPENLPYLAIGGGSKTLPGLMAREFLANSYGQIANNPRIAQARANMGEEYDSAIEDVLMAGAGGSIFAGTLHVGVPAAGRLIDASADLIAPGRRAGKALEAAELPDIGDDEVVRRFSEAVPAEIRTPDERAATHVINRQTEIDAVNPYARSPAGMDAHASQLQAAMEALLGARRADRSAPPIAEPASPAEIKAAIAQHESGGNPDARNPLPGQTASGLYGFTNPTFKSLYRQVYGPASDAQILARKNDPAVQERLMDAAIAGYGQALDRAGMPSTPGNLYMMHFLGPAKAIEVIRAPADTPIAALVKERWIAVNEGLLRGKTAGDVRAEMDRRTAGVDPATIAGDTAPAGLGELALLEQRPSMPEPGRVDLGAARSAIAEVAAPAHDVGPGELWRASPDDLERMVSEKGLSDRAKLVRALGEDGAAEFERLDRKRNSADPQRSDEGSREFEERFGDLTPEQERLVYGIGESDAQADDIALVLKAHGDALAGDDRDWLGYMAGTAARRLTPDDMRAVLAGEGSAPAQAAFVRMSAAYRELAAQGVAVADIPRAMVDGMVSRGVDPAHAAELVEGFAADLAGMRAPAPPPALIDAIEVVAPRSVSAPEQLKLFDDPAGDGARSVGDSLAHDLRTDLEADTAAGSYRLAEGDERPIGEILASIDADEAAIAAVRACL